MDNGRKVMPVRAGNDRTNSTRVKVNNVYYEARYY